MNLKEIYSRYHCAQLAEKYKDTYEEGKKTGDFESNINHDILVLNDASTDGTQEWIESLNDPDLLEYHNH